VVKPESASGHELEPALSSSQHRVPNSILRGVSQKVKGLLKKAHLLYTEMKLVLLFNVIPLDFNAPVPAFHNFSNSVREKFFLVASLTGFARHHILKRNVAADETWVQNYEPNRV
jgi:hypothetical protein